MVKNVKIGQIWESKKYWRSNWTPRGYESNTGLKDIPISNWVEPESLSWHKSFSHNPKSNKRKTKPKPIVGKIKEEKAGTELCQT